MTKALIFDLDGTLVEKWSTTPLPGVAEKLAALTIDPNLAIAVATNQAGIAWRQVTGNEKYPTAAQFGQRIAAIVSALPALATAHWHISIYDPRISLDADRWRGIAAAIRTCTALQHCHTSSDPAWRKPTPGMLLAICQELNVEPGETLYIGDSADDEKAAQAAGVPFQTVTAWLA